MASQYAYTISLFDADRRKQGPKFQGVVSSTLKPLESQVSKEEVFVTTFYTARDHTDQFANLNFIINMKCLKAKEPPATVASDPSTERTIERTENRERTERTEPVAGPSSAAD